MTSLSNDHLDLERVDLERVDLGDLALFADGPPWELFARLRAEAPVHYNGNPDLRFWSITRHADVREVSRDWETYSSERGGVNLRDDDTFPIEVARLAMINMDPPKHAHLRAIVQKAFTPRVVADREEDIRRIVEHTLDEVVSRGECDIVKDIAVPVPLAVIAAMLGVPPEDHRMLFDWTNRIAGFEDPLLRKDAQDGLAAMGEIAIYLNELVGRRRQDTSDDLVSRLIAAEVDGERLDDGQLVLFFILLMGAGNETTRNTFTGGLLALIEHPAEQRKLVAQPGLIPLAIEEILRWTSAVVHFRRTATRDVTLDGVQIREGDKVVMWYASANRDERVFSAADRFDATRPESELQQQFAFGGGGRHFCLGNQLARLELRVMFESVLRRMRDLELTDAPQRQRTNLFNAYLAAPMSFNPIG